jgi:apolipoprotein N-acyltransferase
MTEPLHAENDGDRCAPAAAPATEKRPHSAAAEGAITPLPALKAYGLAFLCGFLYFVSFPGIDVWPLALVALVPLIVALRGQSPRRALGLGWMAGFTMTMFGFYWLLEMLQIFSGFPVPLCVLFMAILCAYQAGRIALCGWLYGRAERGGWPAPIAFSLAFVASELVFPLLFPWYYGATVHNAPALMQVAELGGPYLIALVLIAPNLAIAEIILARRERRPYARRLAVFAGAALGAALLYGAARIASVDARARDAKPVKIGIIQGNQPLLERGDAIRVHLRRSQELKAAGAELVIWSEGASGTAYPESPHEEEVRRRLTQKLGVPSVVGTLLVRPTRPKATFFNTALLTDEKGEILGRYDKHYLLAFGEYIPFGELFPVLYTWSPHSSRFNPGTAIDPMLFGDHKISALICYEDILPGFVNKVVRHATPDLLVNLTNDSWFGNSTEPWIHFALAKLRAVEHRRYLIRATNSGVSGIIDPVGRTILHGSTYKEEGLLGEARFMRATTVYEVVGDAPWYLGTVAIAFMAFRSRHQKWLPKKEPKT